MSIRMMSEVWGLDLPDSQKIVLLALADCTNDEGLCWPSIATLCKKCTKSERTIQGVIKQLVEAGLLERIEVPGKGCKYIVNPRRICAPKAANEDETPPQNLRPAESAPPQGLPVTPAAAAGKPSRTPNIKHTQKRAGEKIKIPDDWEPDVFGSRSRSRAIVDRWTPDELAAQLEHFTAHHRGRGNRFLNWQDAWSTWVLNSTRFGGNRQNGRSSAGSVQRGADQRETTRETAERIAAELVGASPGHARSGVAC